KATLRSCRPAKRRRNGVLDGHGIRHALRSIENLETYHVAAGIVVQNDAGLILIAFRDRRAAQQDAEDVHFGVIDYFHSALQYFSILLVRLAVIIAGGSSSSSTTTRNRYIFPSSNRNRDW